MDFWNRFFCSASSLGHEALAFFGALPQSACRLQTVDVDGVLVADDSSMLSLVEVGGALVLMGETEFERSCEALEDALSSALSTPAHAIQLFFSYDPFAAKDEVASQMRPLRMGARGLGLELDGVLEDWADSLSSYCATERILLGVWTRPSVMTGAELSGARREARSKPWPKLRPLEAQAPSLVLERMRDVHLALAKNLVECFSSLKFRVRLLSSHEAVHAIRYENAPSLTSRAWRASLPGDPLPLRAPSAGASASDMSSFLYPSLKNQVWPCPASVQGGRFLVVGERAYAPFVMSLPPQVVEPFNVLFQSLIQESIPWRASVLLGGDGMAGNSLKSVAAGVLSFSSLSNKLYQRAIKGLQELSLRGDTAVRFQCVFETWVDFAKSGTQGPEALKELARRQARLATAVQAWGSCDTAVFTGDPLFCHAAALPGATPCSPAPAAIAPLCDAIRLLPFCRPCSPWDTTDLPLRTSDGRYAPVALFHSSQASWNEICFAGMGAGKSFFLNTLNFFYLLRPGQARLPWLTVIDVGSSCSGVIRLIRAALAPAMRHQAVFAKLSNTRKAAINPFDTPLGCSKPLSSHESFLINLLSLICTPLDETAPVDGVTDVLREALSAAYERLSPTGDAPRLFDPYAEPDVAKRLQGLGFACDEGTTWWECVDFLHAEGEDTLALRSQRHAVPLLSDVAAELSNPLIRNRFLSILVKGSSEAVPDACSRRLTSALHEYPILAAPTAFDLGNARIVGLDLAEVTPRGGPAAQRQSGVMYMLARFVGAAHFFYTASDLDRIPSAFREWHRPRFEDLAAAPKRLCYDEFHRVSCQDLANPLSRQIIADLTTASREARKQNLSIGLYSQQLSDFPDVFVELATSVYALGAGSAKEAAEVSRRFGFNAAAHAALRRISRPTPAGANFVALFRTSDGESIHYLANTAGPYARWAFTTTAEDMHVRDRLYDSLGCMRALALLKERFPEGSVRPELERRKLLLDVRPGESGEDVLETLVQELKEAKSSYNDAKCR